MAHIKTQNKSKTQNLEKKQLATVRSSELESPDTSLFYELEAAIVIDVIRDETHPIFSPSNPEVPMVEGSTACKQTRQWRENIQRFYYT